MKLHNLKCWPEHFQAVWDGHKTAELRKDDRGFAVGDRLVLEEWEPMGGIYSGRAIIADVSHVFVGGPWLAAGYAMLSLQNVRTVEQGFFSAAPVYQEEEASL